MPDPTSTICGTCPSLADMACLAPTLNAVVDAAWHPGWAPAALVRLVQFCGALREGTDSEKWAMLRHSLRQHPVRRLVMEDPLARLALEHPGDTAGHPLLRDLLLGLGEGPRMLEQASRAGRDLFAVSSQIGLPAGLRGQAAFLASVVEGVLERQPGAEILTLGAGHLREAALVRQRGAIGRWVAQATEQDVLTRMRDSLPSGLPVRSLRCSLGGFVCRPYMRGCFDLILLPLLPDALDANGLRNLADAAFAALKPGGILLIGSPAGPAPEAAWMEAFLHWRPTWRTTQDLLAAFAVLPPAQLTTSRAFSSPEGRLVYAMAERRRR